MNTSESQDVFTAENLCRMNLANSARTAGIENLIYAREEDCGCIRILCQELYTGLNIITRGPMLEFLLKSWPGVMVSSLRSGKLMK